MNTQTERPVSPEEKPEMKKARHRRAFKFGTTEWIRTTDPHHVKVVTGQAQVAERKGKQGEIEAGKTEDSEHAETTTYGAIPRITGRSHQAGIYCP